MKKLMHLLILAFLCLHSFAFAAEPIETEMVWVPMVVGQEKLQLEAKIYKPAGKGPFPVMIVNHGSPRSAEARENVSAETQFQSQCEAFAELGFATMILVRRGYGNSEGEYAELKRNEDGTRDYKAIGLEVARDIEAAVSYMKSKSYADQRKIVLLGQSAGGHGVLAASSLNWPGVIGIVNFAGGRGSTAPDVVEDEPNLIASFAAYGKTSRVPTIWFYSLNDGYFGPEVAEKFREAFVQGGGRAEFVSLPEYGEDGHSSFARAMDVWYSRLVQFLMRIKAI